MSYVSIKNVGKKYENSEHLSVKDFNIEIKQGEFIVFIGPSGCGKSTTLRMVAGLEEISEGEIFIDGNLINDVHPKDRDIAMVFQSYALYPHMTVFQNIAFALEMSKTPKEEIKEKVEWAANILGLTDLLDRKPKALSGGQRQRVALGRAIVRQPKVFLMDEPLSNLDTKLRVDMRNEITTLHEKLGATTIYVTHDQVEAMTMADRIVILKDGIIQQVGTPLELYNNPINTFVASFIGAPKMNFLDVKVEGEYLILGSGQKLLVPGGILKLLEGKGSEFEMGFRPEHIGTSNLELDTYKDEVISGIVTNIERMGHDNYFYTSIGENKISIRISNDSIHEKGKEIKFRLNLSKAHFFDKNTGISIKNEDL